MFYGWYVVLGSTLGMALLSGVSFWSFTLYVQPVEGEFGWSRAEVSFGFSAALLISGLAGPIVGKWTDAKGPRLSILIGAITTAVTYLLLATTATLWQWYLYQAINAICRQFMFIIPFQALVSRWFDRRRGTAVGVLGTGFSLGGFAFVPLMGWAIDTFTWQGAMALSGVAIAAYFVPFCLFVVRNNPADIGERLDGDRVAEGEVERPQTPTGVPLGVALRTPLFWTLAVALSLFFYGLLGWLIHQVPFYESVGIDRSAATLLVSLGAGLGMIARVGFGLVVDRLRMFEPAAMTLALALLLAMVVYLVSTSPVAVGIFLMLYIIGAAGGPMMEAILLTRAFGVAHFATLFGVVMIVETTGQIVSPTIAGYIYDTTGAYDWALVMWIGTFGLSFVLFAIASRMRRPELPARSW